MPRGLNPSQAACAYDRIGRLQNWQSFYEGPAIRELVRRGDWEQVCSVYELGPGTGELARRLLTEYLPPEAAYRGVDVSPGMVRLARERLHRWADRARVDGYDGSLPLPGGGHAYDRFLAVYVFDIFPDAYAADVLAEARRLLVPGGRLGLVGLTPGDSWLSRAVSKGWRRIWDFDARVVGGCRPVRLSPFLEGAGFRVEHRSVVEAWGIASEVVWAVL